MYGGEPPLKVKPMKKALLGLVALPIALIGGTESAMAYGLGNWNSYYYPNSYTINGPGNYSGRYSRIGGFHTYSNNYGSTTCSAIGSYINCW